MKCPECVKEGARSTMTPGGFSTTTCMAFSPGHFDEDGKWVAHRDPNITTTGYTCSRGHRWMVQSGGFHDMDFGRAGAEE